MSVVDLKAYVALCDDKDTINAKVVIESLEIDEPFTTELFKVKKGGLVCDRSQFDASLNKLLSDLTSEFLSSVNELETMLRHEFDVLCKGAERGD